jgi:hypothetical protein
MPEKIRTAVKITAADMQTTAFSGPFYGKMSILAVMLQRR